MTLSDEMRRCLDFVQRHGGRIHRHPGGYWAAEEWRSGTGESFSATTVAALVARRVLAYSEWKRGRQGLEFPIEASLVVEKEDVTA